MKQLLAAKRVITLSGRWWLQYGNEPGHLGKSNSLLFFLADP